VILVLGISRTGSGFVCDLCTLEKNMTVSQVSTRDSMRSEEGIEELQRTTKAKKRNIKVPQNSAMNAIISLRMALERTPESRAFWR